MNNKWTWIVAAVVVIVILYFVFLKTYLSLIKNQRGFFELKIKIISDTETSE